MAGSCCSSCPPRCPYPSPAWPPPPAAPQVGGRRAAGRGKGAAQLACAINQCGGKEGTAGLRRLWPAVPKAAREQRLAVAHFFCTPPPPASSRHALQACRRAGPRASRSCLPPASASCWSLRAAPSSCRRARCWLAACLAGWLAGRRRPVNHALAQGRGVAAGCRLCCSCIACIACIAQPAARPPARPAVALPAPNFPSACVARPPLLLADRGGAAGRGPRRALPVPAGCGGGVCPRPRLRHARARGAARGGHSRPGHAAQVGLLCVLCALCMLCGLCGCGGWYMWARWLGQSLVSSGCFAYFIPLHKRRLARAAVGAGAWWAVTPHRLDLCSQ